MNIDLDLKLDGERISIMAHGPIGVYIAACAMEEATAVLRVLMKPSTEKEITVEPPPPITPLPAQEMPF